MIKYEETPIAIKGCFTGITQDVIDFCHFLYYGDACVTSEDITETIHAIANNECVVKVAERSVICIEYESEED